MAKSRIMETTLDKAGDAFMELCKKRDVESSGKFHLSCIKTVLMNCNHLVLTPFQINTLLGYSKPDEKGYVDYQAFSEIIKPFIDSHFSVDALRRQAQLVQLGTFKP